MIKKIVVGLCSLLLVGVLAAQVMPEEKVYDTGKALKKPMVMEPFKELQNARKIPDVSFLTANGKEVSISDLKGKAVLINVWATWCEPCIREIPQIIETQKKLKGSDLVFVGVSVDEDQATAKSFLEKHNFQDFETWFDPTTVSSDSIMPLTVVPTNYFLDGSGNLVGFFRNYLPWTDPEVYPFLLKFAEKYKDK